MKAQTGEDLLRVALKLVSAQMLKAILHVAVLFEQGVDVSARFGNLGNLELKLLCALPHLGDLVGRGNDLFDDGRVAGKVGFLLEVSHLGSLGELDRARIWRIDTHDDLEHGGLAGTVGANKGITLPCVDLERGPTEERARPEAFLNLVYKKDHLTTSPGTTIAP